MTTWAVLDSIHEMGQMAQQWMWTIEGNWGNHLPKNKANGESRTNEAAGVHASQSGRRKPPQQGSHSHWQLPLMVGMAVGIAVGMAEVPSTRIPHARGRSRSPIVQCFSSPSSETRRYSLSIEALPYRYTLIFTFYMPSQKLWTLSFYLSPKDPSTYTIPRVQCLS